MATSMAVAAAQKASASMIPPASPFSELLRRSRFATYDPAIRQTYFTPQSYAHRGNWGLKRPLSHRRKNAFISISQFEAHQHYCDWDNAESEVRFIRRVEEMGTMPRLAVNTPWEKGLGKARNDWIIDSEFAAKEGSEQDLVAQQNTAGSRGPGGYSARRPIRKSGEQMPSHLIPNINAMTPRNFVRYLRKLRELRPAFQEHVKAMAEKDTDLAGASLYKLSQNPAAGYHRKFIQAHTAREFESTESAKIEPQPHLTGGLIYSHPSALSSYYHTKYQPGLVVSQGDSNIRKGLFTSKDDNFYVASFGGISATLKKQNAGQKVPLLDPKSEKGVDSSKVEASVANMRLVLGSGLTLERPPKVVGHHAPGLSSMSFRAEVTTDNAPGTTELSRDNPYFPGTFEYNAAQPLTRKSQPAVFLEQSRKANLMAATTKFVYRKNTGMKGGAVIGMLQNMLNKEPSSDEGL